MTAAPSTSPAPGVEAPRGAFERGVRRCLCLSPEPAPDAAAGAARALQVSILASAIRCLITYILVPFVMPVVGFLAGVAAPVGLVLNAVAAVFVVASVRRFFASDHRYRWAMLAVGSAMMVFIIVSIVFDIRTLVG